MKFMRNAFVPAFLTKFIFIQFVHIYLFWFNQNSVNISSSYTARYQKAEKRRCSFSTFFFFGMNWWPEILWFVYEYSKCLCSLPKWAISHTIFHLNPFRFFFFYLLAATTVARMYARSQNNTKYRI